jgi:hypothetical protein
MPRGLHALLWLAGSTRGDIPKRLITSHKLPLDQVPAALRRNIEEWQNLNPTFAFQYFDDAAQQAWMAERCQVKGCIEAYRKLSSGAGKADLFRVAWLIYEGGWWFDADLKPGPIATACDLETDSQLDLFAVREPKNGHVRFMVIGGMAHPLFHATLKRQISNIFEAKRLPVKKQPRTLHVTGPFTLGRTICDPFRHASAADLVGAQNAREGHAGAKAIAAFCGGAFFNGQGESAGREAKADWAGTYGPNTPLAFRFDGCGGHWHRPGARMSYAAVLAEMNVTHHLKITA